MDQVNDACDNLEQDLSRGSMPCCPQHSTSTLGFGFDIQLLYFLSRRISVYRGQIKCVSNEFSWQHGSISSLESEKVVHLVGQGREVGVNASEDIELGKKCFNMIMK